MKAKLQTKENECALAVVAALYFYYYRKDVSIAKLRSEVALDARGLNLHSLISLGAQYQLELNAFSASYEEFLAALIPNNPVVTLISNEHSFHYVTVEKLNSKELRVFDPMRGVARLSYSDLAPRYRGIFLKVAPLKKKLAAFKSQRQLYMELYQRHARLLLGMSIVITLTLIFSFVAPLFLKIVFDQVIPGALTQTLLILTIGFGLIITLRVITTFIRSILTRHLHLLFEAKININYAQKMQTGVAMILKSFTDSAHWQNISLIPGVANFLASAPFIIFSEVLSLIVSSAFLLWLSPSLFAFVLAGGATLLLLTIILRLSSGNLQLQTNAYHNAYIQSLLDVISARLNLKSPRLSKPLMSAFDQNRSALQSNDNAIFWRASIYKSITLALELLLPLVVAYSAAKLVFNSQMSPGSMLIFLNFTSLFISPFGALTELGFNFQLQKRNYKLIESFLLVADENANANGKKMTKVSSITFRNYAFSYDRPLFTIPHLVINGSISLTGRNGSGKTSLLQVINATQFGQGELMINDIDLKYYDLISYRRRVLLVSHNDVLPHTSISNFLTQNRPELSKHFHKSMELYPLSQLLTRMRIDLQTIISNNGQAFSAGQRQTILLLQMLADDYDVVLLDEALESLDDFAYQFFVEFAKNRPDIIFIEISHTNKFLLSSPRVNFETFTTY